MVTLGIALYCVALCRIVLFVLAVYFLYCPPFLSAVR